MRASQQFLEQQSDINDLINLDAIQSGFVAPLADLGLLALSGQDAASLLHRLLTNDVERLRTSEARLAGICSQKGRLQGSFLVWKSGDAIMLQLPREIQPSTHKRMQMYVMRDKVEITDVTTENVLLGMGGQAAQNVLTNWFPELPAEPYGLVHNETGTLIRVADAFDAPRFEWILSKETLNNIWPALSANLTLTNQAAWRLADIDAGIPQIVTATQEQFVPQMVNYELVGGVSFKKGCFIGQEIVARTQHLGKIRRRMLAATIEMQSAPSQTLSGVDVYSSEDPSQPCGMIVNAEYVSDATVMCLVSMRLDAAESGTIHLGDPNGPALQFKPLPYALPTEAE